MIETHYERRIALLEQNISELNALVCGYRLALEEAEQKVAELTRLHVCESSMPAAASVCHPERGNGSMRSNSPAEPRKRK